MTSPDDKPNQEHAAYWLIERGSPAEWWAGTDRIAGPWTRDVSQVHPMLKFPTREQAQHEADRIADWPMVQGAQLRVTDHLDCYGPVSSIAPKPLRRWTMWLSGEGLNPTEDENGAYVLFSDLEAHRNTKAGEWLPLLEMFSDKDVLLHGAAGEDAMNVGDVHALVSELARFQASRSAIEPTARLRRFAAKCRPSVAHYMRTQERAAMSSAVSPAGKEVAEREAAWLGRLLDEIDSLTVPAERPSGASDSRAEEKP